jgi:hypothetical protein
LPDRTSAASAPHSYNRWDAAVANGLHYFVADVLAENYLMLKVISDVGWPCTRHLDSAVFRIELDLANLDGAKPGIIERPQ